MNHRALGLLFLIVGAAPALLFSQETAPPAAEATWKLGAPIVTYWSGPDMSEKVAAQMAAEGFNTVWTDEANLDTLQKHELRGILQDALLSPASLDSFDKRRQLDELIERVRQHPALYCYYLGDEPSATKFEKLGKMVSYLRAKDPRHFAYINLLPVYASDKQLGVTTPTTPPKSAPRAGGPKGSQPLVIETKTTTSYSRYLSQYMGLVRPQLISYDHYQFMVGKDTDQYLLNLEAIRNAALAANVPFLNVVQACTWPPGIARVPTPNEMRYLVYTTAAYGAQGISYYVYTRDGHQGGIRLANGAPTPIHDTVSELNRQFAALATELGSLRSLAVYYTSAIERGCDLLPENARFRPQKPAIQNAGRGLMFGYFGPESNNATHALVVNLDYRGEVKSTIVAPAKLERFDTETQKWLPLNDDHVELTFPPGGGHLLRLAYAIR